MAKRMPIAAILAGGLGTRLRPVTDDKPKVMADVGGRPFLSYLLDQLIEHGFEECVLCVGYKSEQIESYFCDSYKGLSLLYSMEPEPLGTGGALKNALPVLNAKTLVMNGDSYCNADLSDFSRGENQILVGRHGGSRYGSVGIDKQGNIVHFKEKEDGDLFNYGVYILTHDFIESIPDENVSLEYDVFPNRELGAYITDGEFIDIGTPESYERAEEFFRRLRQG